MITWTAGQEALRAGLTPWFGPLSAEHIEQDAAGGFHWEKWKLVQQTGILGLPFGREWGGGGHDLLTTMYVLEALGQGCRDAGLNFCVATHLVGVGVPLQRFGSQDLRRRFLPQLCAGDAIGAHAITEPGGGSDALSMQTHAVREGDHFVLRGKKSFVSNGPVAGLFTVYARTHPDGGPLGITAFLVERQTPGVSVGPPLPTMGLRTSPMSEITFDGCSVPASNVVGRVGTGFLVLDYVMKWEVLCSFIVNAGEMRHRLDRCIEYARKRFQFGKAIGEFQAVAHKIVEMKIGLDTSRKWLYDTAVKLMAGESVTVDTAIAKLVTSENNIASALSALQIFGGYGYLTEYGLEKDVRNAVAGTIYSGTSEIQRNRISSMLGL